MQDIIVAEPYRLVTPHRGRFWPWLLPALLLRRELRREHGVESVELRGIERLRASVAAGHGILLTPNHCRPSDPLIPPLVARAAGRPLYAMASWHLFKQGWFQAWVLRSVGVFSVHREGMDREALRLAIDLLAEAERPLVLFPEGVVTRTNDRLIHLMDGTEFIARQAAKALAASGTERQVVVHPVAIRYFHDGDVAATVAPVLTEIERRLSWRPRPDLPVGERVARVGGALIALKEIEHLGAAQSGTLAERLDRLIDHLLAPLETEWTKGRRESGGVVVRVKTLRMAIVPDLASRELPEEERARRWRQLEDLYLAQQLSCYPPDYLEGDPTPERLLETVERFEEDLTDRARPHPPMRAVVEVGEAIVVPPVRDRSPGREPLMEQVRRQLEALLEGLRAARRTAP